MKAEDVQQGDILPDPVDGHPLYTVESVTVNRPHVVATVRFADGGNGRRMWELGKDTSLTRPTQ